MIFVILVLDSLGVWTFPETTSIFLPFIEPFELFTSLTNLFSLFGVTFYSSFLSTLFLFKLCFEPEGVMLNFMIVESGSLLPFTSLVLFLPLWSTEKIFPGCLLLNNLIGVFICEGVMPSSRFTLLLDLRGFLT